MLTQLIKFLYYPCLVASEIQQCTPDYHHVTSCLWKWSPNPECYLTITYGLGKIAAPQMVSGTAAI